jgi:glycerol-3-phosphate dehydrogenase
MVREYARTVVDVIARRTRLAFLNWDAASEAVPRVAALMARELGWDDARVEAEVAAAHAFMRTMLGKTPAAKL